MAETQGHVIGGAVTLPEKELRLTVLQLDPVWEQPEANLHALSSLTAGLAGQTDLILLPEMFATGFSMQASRIAEEAGKGPVVRWMQTQAAATGALVAGSVAVREAGRCYNRFYAVYPEGTWVTYDKRHLFRMGKEHLNYTPGKTRVTFGWKGWRFLPQVCYDLRFPAWSRNRNDYDVALYAANWPAARQDVLLTLAKARALENNCYVAVSNRIGRDGLGVLHQGESRIIGYKGEVLATASQEAVSVTATLSYKALQEFRKKFPVWMDTDFFTIS